MGGYGLDNPIRHSVSAVAVVSRGSYQVLLVQDQLTQRSARGIIVCMPNSLEHG